MMIYSMVQKEGGVPDKGKKKFWVKMQTRWNEENPDDKYTRWEGIYKAYNNIAAKLSIGQLSDD